MNARSTESTQYKWSKFTAIRQMYFEFTSSHKSTECTFRSDISTKHHHLMSIVPKRSDKPYQRDRNEVL
jgi:hypothetical protein